MTSLDELQSTLETALTVAGLDVDTIEHRPHATIVPNRRVDTAGRRAFEVLTELATAGTSSMLELHGTIGEGGMGIVRVGTQRALGRAVAVKTLKDEHVGDEITLKLLREAWVTGSLEHPNVVPVYDIALDARSRPQIILKKIEGDEWAELMHDEAAIRSRFNVDDPLEWNLRTLMQVCNAVRFAHSRGILHRDLKPENVMIGSFGEVYVVDWGIAVSLTDDGSGRIPLATDAKEIAGTPVYMAPEMLGGPVSKLSERSDVYLLGAILYEICVGEPPHCGEVFMEMVASIVASEPEIGEDVPAELARIVRHAMRPDPDARFENVEQLRLAVSAFLSHRDGMRLAERAEERLVKLDALIAETSSDEGEPSDGNELIAPLFSECRFGFRQALEVWPQNELARAGLDRALTSMIGYELSKGRATHARSLLGEMGSAPDELNERVEAALRDEAEERARLEKLSAQYDPQKGRRTRVFVSSIVGLLWTVSPLVFYFAPASVEYTQLHGVAFTLVALVLIGGLGYWARESMMGTAINRLVSFASVVVMSSYTMAAIGGYLVGQDPAETLHGQFVVWTAVAVLVGLVIEKRFFLAAVGYLIGYFVLAVVGLDHIFLTMALCNSVVPIVGYSSWGKLNEDFGEAGRRLEARRLERHRRLREHRDKVVAALREP